MVGVSTITSRMSIVGSLLAGMYQLYLGCLYEGVDGFSPLLLCGWLLGDIFNVVGTSWGDQMGFQQVVAFCSLGTDILLLLQHLYYSKKRWSPRPSHSGYSPTLAMAAILPRVTAIGPSSSGFQIHDIKFLIGQGCSWIAESLYVCAIIPQVLENFRRKCTGSVSLVIFLADCISSVNYLTTILVTATSKPRPIEFVIGELPYILGSSASVLLDSALLVQYWIYPQFRISEIQEGQPLLMVLGEDPCKLATGSPSHSPSLSPLKTNPENISSYGSVQAPEPLMHLP